MYFQLTGALKRRFIEELRRYWMHHPKYRDDLPNNIQGKFSFKERPQHGIIVKTGSGTKVDLSADNYLGVVESYCLLTRVANKPGFSLEWIREDSVAIQKNKGMFPSQAGVYYIDVQEGESGGLVFYVDPLLDVSHEPVSLITPTTAQLSQPPLTGTLRLYEMPSGFRYVEGVNYTLDRDLSNKITGGVTLVNPLTGGRWLQADYRYPIESRGPFPIIEMNANNVAIPGVVLAFGRRVEAGDQLAVMVHDIRRPAYMEYGGRWDMTLEFDVMSRDHFAQQEIVDQTIIYLWGVLRSHLSHQGIEITDISMGGESEEVFDENGDDYFYTANFSLTAQTEWSIHVPLDNWLRSAVPLTSAQAAQIAALSDDQLGGQDGNIKVMEALGIQTIEDPFWSGRTGTFEVVR